MSRRSTGRALVATSAVAVSVLASVVTVPTPASGQVPAGSTWYSDGTWTKAGPSGTVVKAYAVAALQNVSYVLALGNDGGDPGHGTTPCLVTVAVLNANVVRAGPNGLIATVTGTVPSVPPGLYQLCFKDSSASNATATAGATFTVL